MTDAVERAGNSEEAYDIDHDPDGVTREQLTGIDGALELYLDLLFGPNQERPDSRAGLTLMVPGGLVSGTAVSFHNWIRLCADSMREGHAVPMGEAFQEMFTDGLEYLREDAADRQERGLPSVAQRFIHLKDVTVFAGPHCYTLPFWRVRIKQISGWAPGIQVHPGGTAPTG
jgi:hypothetical protein